MAKLGHAETLEGLKKSELWQSDSGINERVIITSDGFLVTKNLIYPLLSNYTSKSNNSILIKDSTGINAISAPTSASILKWNGTSFEWSADKNEIYYNLTINGTTNGTSEGTSLGSIYAPTSSGKGIPSLNDTTWSWNQIITEINDSTNAGIPTVDAIKKYVTAGISGITTDLTGAFQYIKDVSADPTTTAPTAPEGGWKPGNVIGWNNKEYLYTSGGTWREFGDEGSYALRTITVTGTGALTGGGDLSANRTIDMAKITVSNSKGNNNIVNGVTTDDYGRVTAVSYATAALTDTWQQNKRNQDGYITSLGATDTYKIWSSINTSTDPAWIDLWLADKTHIGGIKLKSDKTTGNITYHTTAQPNATGNYEVKMDKDGQLFVSVPTTNTNTWRPIYAWKASDLGKTNDTIDDLLDYGNTGVKKLAFSSTFGYKDGTSDDVAEIDLVWAEVDKDGKITYSV